MNNKKQEEETLTGTYKHCSRRPHKCRYVAIKEPLYGGHPSLTSDWQIMNSRTQQATATTTTTTTHKNIRTPRKRRSLFFVFSVLIAKFRRSFGSHHHQHDRRLLQSFARLGIHFFCLFVWLNRNGTSWRLPIWVGMNGDGEQKKNTYRHFGTLHWNVNNFTQQFRCDKVVNVPALFRICGSPCARQIRVSPLTRLYLARRSVRFGQMAP